VGIGKGLVNGHIPQPTFGNAEVSDEPKSSVKRAK